MSNETDKQRANELHEAALVLSEAGKDDEAIPLYLKALALNPEKSETYYNLGLIYKYRCDWPASFKYNQQAYEKDPEHEAACWNLGIAATALEDWSVARAMWTAYGIQLDNHHGVIHMNFGTTPVRLNPDDDAEVVWAKRICPARAQVMSVPFPESGFCYGDVVLNDGAPVGEREVDGQTYPVFNVLQRLSVSSFVTGVAQVEAYGEQSINRLYDWFDDTQHALEDWTQSVRILCKQCSEGVPHEHDGIDSESNEEWAATRRLGIAAQAGDWAAIQAIFTRWEAEKLGRLIILEQPK